jgi:hypothetical protein
MDNPSRAEANARATFKRWVREAFPEIAETMDAAADEDNPIIRDVLVGKGKVLVAEATIANEIRRTGEELADYHAQLLAEWPKRRPWLAHKASNVKGGVRYESEAVIEVEHVDGSLTYECALEGCEYTNPNPRGVAVHYGKAHTMKGEVEPASQNGPTVIDPEYTEPLLDRDYNPTARLVDALVEVLAKLNGHGTDREKAVEILRWFRLRPDIEHTTRDTEPLSDSDILGRIRRLVGQPDLREELQAARDELGIVIAENEVLKRQRDEANAHLVRVQSDLDGIKELMEGVGR